MPDATTGTALACLEAATTVGSCSTCTGFVFVLKLFLPVDLPARPGEIAPSGTLKVVSYTRVQYLESCPDAAVVGPRRLYY